jgi:hypothetical protein
MKLFFYSYPFHNLNGHVLTFKIKSKYLILREEKKKKKKFFIFFFLQKFLNKTNFTHTFTFKKTHLQR